MNKKIRVVIPAFNRPEMLSRAIESVTRSGTEGLDLVVVDDASGDDLSMVRRRVESEGHRWLALGENIGPGGARNRGSENLDADWLCFLDSDDYWLDGKMEAQLEFHRRNPEFRISQVEEKWIRNGEELKKPSHWIQREGDLFSASVERCSIGPSCVMMHRELWEETGGFDPRFRVCEDYELWLRITAKERIGLVDGGALTHKVAGHPDQLSTIFPAMDRYRVCALLKLLEEKTLTETQISSVEKGIEKKATVLAKGAHKRELVDQALFYSSLADAKELASSSWLAEAWRWCG